VDNSLSRLSFLSNGTGAMESYKYLGLGTVVDRDHSQIKRQCWKNANYSDHGQSYLRFALPISLPFPVFFGVGALHGKTITLPLPGR
jgi:hypothetical protein